MQKTKQMFSKCARLTALGVLLSAFNCFALPFNDDMVDVQKRTGFMMRPKDPRSVAVGSLSYYSKDRAEAESKSNPQPASASSIATGTRLYRVNCFPCHGDIESKPWQPGPVGKKLGVVPNIQGTDEQRNKDYKAVGDGWIYGVIHYGSVSTVMPAYGWKLSPSEHWDIINYVRSAQRKVG